MQLTQIIQNQSGYKPFMDGLRAVAILAVVAYHVGIDGISGGFIGVDVFFVISGYLICTHLMSALGTGKFSFGEFWARRALRILPSYLLVIAVCMLIAPFVLVLPNEYAEFGKQAAYSSVMLANHYFLSLQGYFDGSADSKPLLHLWSLAVEEQFYIAAPIILFCLYSYCQRLQQKYARITAILVIATVFALSLYGCIRLSGQSTEKNYAFFLTALRAWEFIFGGAIALLVPVAKRMPRLILESAALIGLTLIANAVFTYNGTNPYPSTKAFFPVLGASLVILSGIVQPKVLVARLLAFRPFILIGLISYTWYLWHWPLLTFGRIYSFGERHLPLDLSMAAVSLILAWLTYLFVDRSVLKWRKGLKKGLQWKHVGNMVAACIPVWVLGLLFTSVLAPTIAKSHTEPPIPAVNEPSGLCNLHLAKSFEECITQASGRPIGLLIGDSHAAAAYPVLAHYAQQSDVHLATMTSGGCASILNVYVNHPNLERRKNCENGRANALRIIDSSELRLSFAILISRWDMYSPGSYEIRNADSTPFADYNNSFVQKTRETIKYLQEKGIQKVLVVGPVPSFHTSAPECILRSDKYKISRDTHCSISKDSLIQKRGSILHMLKSSVKGLSHVQLIDPTDLLCDETTCRSYDDTHALYTDTNHMSNAGLDRIYKTYINNFNWVFSNESP